MTEEQDRSNEITRALVATLTAYDSTISLQEVLDGVRDLVASLLISERVEAESFFKAVRIRIPEVRRIAQLHGIEQEEN